MDPLAVLDQFAEALQRGDAVGAAALFTLDATYDEPPAQQLTGRAALQHFFAEFAAAHTAVHFTPGRVVVAADGTRAAAEWRFSFTRTRDGSQTTFEGICLLELRGGEIAAWRGFSARLP